MHPLAKGVRVEGDTVIVTVKGGNENARLLCAALIDMQVPAQQPVGESVAKPLFTQTDYDAERWTALMLLWQLGQVTLTGDAAGMFVVDFEGAESADRTWKGKDQEECVRNVIESFTTEGWDFDAIRPQASAPADQPKQSGPDYRNPSITPAGHNLDLGVHNAAPDVPAAPADDLDALVAHELYVRVASTQQDGSGGFGDFIEIEDAMGNGVSVPNQSGGNGTHLIGPLYSAQAIQSIKDQMPQVKK